MNTKLINVLADVFQLKPREVTADLTKEDVTSWDSLTQMDLVTSIENEFDIALEMLEIVSMVSIKAIVEVLEKKGVNLSAC